ncbi:hypothetical protein [Paucibacter soli]|uniref:hypothetical protein n=1 Tax=Paucibacter soli TaxID=3133433 RepID=UPI003095015F
MHSTEQQALRDFFEQRLLPLARRLRAQGQPLFPLGPEPALASYYLPAAPASLGQADFEPGPAASVAEFGQALARLWHDEPELLALLPELLALLPQLAASAPDGPAELSAFIYAML